MKKSVNLARSTAISLQAQPMMLVRLAGKTARE